jgi:hypothetical protein
MSYSLLADLVMLVHGLYVLFVVCGGLAVLRWTWLARLHLPAAVWGVLIELGGWVCPLTYLENFWRQLAGESGYTGSYIRHYLEPVLYPLGLTRTTQVFLGLLALLLNLAVYTVLLQRLRRKGK